MPSNILTTDTSFPRLTKQQSTDEKFSVVTNYLYMLLEQLRYTLANLGLQNFNQAEFDKISGIITDPVYAELENTNGDLTQLKLTAEGLTLRVQDAEGNISTLQQTATSLTSRIQDAEGNISTLQQTATSLTSRIHDAEGNLSVLQQTAQSLSVRISNTEGDLSTLTQTVNSITLSVSNGDESSTIQLLKNGIAISSQLIQFTGMVTFQDLAGSGKTVINGDNITTGTISALTMDGCTFKSTLGYNGTVGGELEFYYLNSYYLAGGIRLDDQGAGSQYENKYRMFVYTQSVGGVSFALKLQAAGGISIEAGQNIFIKAATRLDIQADTITINGEPYPPTT